MPGVGDVLDGTALLRWGQLCLAGLEHHRDEINALNVFPVADADTGTNMLSTLRAAVRAAEEVAATPPATANTDAPVSGSAIVGVPAAGVAVAMARAATVGARGNSGIILSQVLRGLADAVCDGPLDETALRAALRRAAVLVREALSSPVEGTMLTVLDRAADRAADCQDRSLVAVALAAADGAAKALGETPAQLGVLREAGVVDAGARGLLVMLDQFVAVTGGRVPARPEYVRRGGARQSGTGGAQPGRERAGMANDVAAQPSTSHGRANSFAAEAHRHDAVGDAGVVGDASQYEVMFLVCGTDEQRVGVLRDRLGALGDSVVVVGDGVDTWSAHVHCADAGAAVEAGIAAGVLSGIRIENLAVSGHAPDGPVERGILAVASGAGAVRLFEDSGAAVLEGEVTAESLLAAIRRMPQREVLVLPNGALPAHELVAVSVAARDGQREVLMLPSGSMVQGLAALSMHNGGRAAADDAFAMSEAAAGTRWGALRIAPERALTIVGTCAAGDGLGLVGHDVVVIDADVRAAGRTLLDRMLGLGGELVTMLVGEQAPQGLSDELAAHVASGFPGVEVVVYPGGQAGDLLQIGVE
ncbi:DAK2 domain-containing protein [Nocardia huaxiensis]|uniref:DAK2 domain-containing protein n=1 Tax=Nocardia huaxiensis TaxID=2755382 RepID=A0A7D6ZNW2_9NOCA|nr:DAK2 domain-containing protein [Nocardia huaxiensis]QLY29965.1 DAK2 domain-containing protein [Nocardia huaxiensis]